MAKVKINVPESLTIGGVRYHKGEREVEFNHAVTILMLNGKSKGEAIAELKSHTADPATEPEISEEITEDQNEGEADSDSKEDEEENEEEETEEKTDSKEEEGFPEGFPHASVFEEAGLSFSEVIELEDRTVVNGIAEGRAKEVQEWINKNLSVKG